MMIIMLTMMTVLSASGILQLQRNVAADRGDKFGPKRHVLLTPHSEALCMLT